MVSKITEEVAEKILGSLGVVETPASGAVLGTGLIGAIIDRLTPYEAPIANNQEQVSSRTEADREHQRAIVQERLGEDQESDDGEENQPLLQEEMKSDLLDEEIPQPITDIPVPIEQPIRPVFGGPGGPPPNNPGIHPLELQRIGLEQPQYEERVLVDEIVRDVNPPPQEREEFIVWLTRVINRANESGITPSRLIAGSGAMLDIYYHYREKTLSSYESNDEEGAGNDNEQRREFYAKQGLPPQCRRRIYVDSEGRLRSIVECESEGSHRVYHDK